MSENNSTRDESVRQLVARLIERRKIKYAGDCKCGKCQLVHVDDVYAAADTIVLLSAALKEVTDALLDCDDIDRFSAVITASRALTETK